jgi:squalene-associated FAD-dependent desaturase
MLEKARVAYGLRKLVRLSSERDEPFLPWLRRNLQTQRTIDSFWNIVVVSALNARVEEAGLKYARKVFRDAFWANPRGLDMQIPRGPLGDLYGDELLTWFSKHDVQIELNAGVESFERGPNCVGDRFEAVRLRDGRRIEADACIAAMSFDRSDSLRELAPLPELKPSPITSVHLWYDRSILDLPHLILIDCLGQWVFNRGEQSPGRHYLQVVISASDRTFPAAGNDAIQKAIIDEMKKLFPKARSAEIIGSRTVTERKATFTPSAGIDRFRPGSATTLPNLFLAGDYVQTGWPATMEGAVRSGYAAAEALAKTLYK